MERTLISGTETNSSAHASSAWDWREISLTNSEATLGACRSLAAEKQYMMDSPSVPACSGCFYEYTPTTASTKALCNGLSCIITQTYQKSWSLLAEYI